ncbi:DUF1015 domain-containing protein, partial [Chloroflexota bacterium]
MCDVRPFCGLRYNLQSITSASTVITPPYDVISPDERTRFYNISPYNIIRLEFGAEEPGDTPDNNKYTRAAVTLNDWLHEGVLIRENQPALYVIEHRFSHHDTAISRWGLIARVRLEDFESGCIHPHERTNKEPAVDRLHLLRSCRTNISPIMGLVHTENGEMADLLRQQSQKEPDVSAANGHGVAYRMWVITGKAAIDRISMFLAERDIFIADGHHRYETALRYHGEHPSAAGDESFNFVMMSLMDSQDPGLVMLPTHRLVRGLEPDRIEGLEEKLSAFFKVAEMLPPLPTVEETVRSWLHTLEACGQDGTFIGLYGLHGEKMCLLKLRQDADLDSLMTAEELKLWRELDVVLLQRIVFQAALGISTLEEEAAHLEYTRDGVAAKTCVDSGDCQLVFFLNPAPVSSILDTAAMGMRMPQKSTYFHPKTPAGLVMYPLWD